MTNQQNTVAGQIRALVATGATEWPVDLLDDLRDILLADLNALETYAYFKLEGQTIARPHVVIKARKSAKREAIRALFEAHDNCDEFTPVAYEVIRHAHGIPASVWREVDELLGVYALWMCADIGDLTAENIEAAFENL